MKVLLSWLRDYVDIPSSVDGLAERFEMLGLGVEGLDRFADDAVFDLELPANRGDLMSLVGVAREVAASLRGSVRSPIAAAGGVPRLDAPTAGEAAQGVSPVSGPASGIGSSGHAEMVSAHRRPNSGISLAAHVP